MQGRYRKIVENHFDRLVNRVDFLPGGSVGEVWRVTFTDSFQVIAKTLPKGGMSGVNPPISLEKEARMLDFLNINSRLPLPKLYYSDADLLVMANMPHDGQFTLAIDHAAATLLADLHTNHAPLFGFAEDTVIGPLRQPNPWSKSWRDFFTEQRLLFFGEKAEIAGKLPEGCMGRIERLSAKLSQWLDEPEHPSLIHGDVWGGNILVYQGKISAFIDPACYYADREIELAYTQLFQPFGQDFLKQYQKIHGLSANFFDTKCPLYNLYPLLVHACLFGGDYGQSADLIIKRFVGTR